MQRLLFGDFEAEERGGLVYAAALFGSELTQWPQAEQARVDSPIAPSTRNSDAVPMPGSSTSNGGGRRANASAAARFDVVVTRGARQSPPESVHHQQRKVVVSPQHVEDAFRTAAARDRRGQGIAASNQAGERVLATLALDPCCSLGDQP